MSCRVLLSYSKRLHSPHTASKRNFEADGVESLQFPKPLHSLPVAPPARMERTAWVKQSGAPGRSRCAQAALTPLCQLFRHRQKWLGTEPVRAGRIVPALWTPPEANHQNECVLMRLCQNDGQTPDQALQTLPDAGRLTETHEPPPGSGVFVLA